MRTAGSPPRMRGKLFGYLALREACGITPAHAGKTMTAIQELMYDWDHPRACGENLNWIPSSCSILGSPPRMRGKQGVGGFRPRPAGITPAHAGKTSRRSQGISRKGDHPRACGENSTISQRSVRSEGSPPRMRGKHISLKAVKVVLGITPAHAGKTASPCRSRTRVRDHPRACGENDKVAVKKSCKAGSPPRMRGKLPNPIPVSHLDGITPAHAGKTLCATVARTGGWDHPRACGENPHFLRHECRTRGSPPRMRGKRWRAEDEAELKGITPAHAGKTDGRQA